MKKSIMAGRYEKAGVPPPALLLLDLDIKSLFREDERGKYWGKKNFLMDMPFIVLYLKPAIKKGTDTNYNQGKSYFIHIPNSIAADFPVLLRFPAKL